MENADGGDGQIAGSGAGRGAGRDAYHGSCRASGDPAAGRGIGLVLRLISRELLDRFDASARRALAPPISLAAC